MNRSPDIELEDNERVLLEKIAFDSSIQNEIQASIIPMVALTESLLNRGAVPEVRTLYITDPDRNPGGRGKSRQEIFEKNGTLGSEIYAHVSFLKYLHYFVYGPNLPQAIILLFKETAAFSGHLSGHDIQELTPKAKAAVKALSLEPQSAAEEFHKLALECGANPNSAVTLRQSVRNIRLPQRR